MSILKMREILGAFCSLLILIGVVTSTPRKTALIKVQAARKSFSTGRITSDENDPVVLSTVKYGQLDVGFDREFDAPDGWWKDISFKLRNKSTKNVTYVQIDIKFPDTASTGASLVRQKHFGRLPGRESKDVEILLKSGDAIDFSMSTEFDGLKRSIETRQSANSIKRLTVTVYTVIFEDGIKWYSGNYFKPDPSGPSGYTRIEVPPDIISPNIVR